MTRIIRILPVFIIMTLLVGNFGVANAQTGNSKYFAQTGHWVVEDFYEFYTSVKDPELLFGYPITEAFRDARTGKTIQYFQRAVFELAPEQPQPGRVKLVNIGTALYEPSSQSLDISNTFACRTYAQTGMQVCFAFLDFYDKYGAEAQFGYPISGFEIYNGRIVQWFERARLEWYPELPEGQKVVIASLGRIYFDSLPEDPKLLAPVTGNALAGSQVLQLQPRVFVSRAVTRQNDEQQVYVVVQDQTHQPVYNANVVIKVGWADGTTSTMMLVSDRNGIAAARLKFTDQPYGSLVFITAEIAYGDLKARALTSFRIWQ